MDAAASKVAGRRGLGLAFPPMGDTGGELSGRLELTWTNKPLRLLAHEDGSYEWVPASDYRVAEVRLLDDATTVGDVSADSRRARDNLLLRGDALNALTSLAELPEFQRELIGKVKLAYLDPPFNTQQSWLHYDDALEHSVWLGMMRDRLVQVKKLLSPDGSVWVHCDDSEQAYLKVMMDELFGRNNFVATVVWEKVTSARNDAKHFSTDQDYLLVYARDKEQFSPRGLSRTEASDAAYRNPDNDPRGPWREGDYKCGKTADERPNLYYPIEHSFTGKEVWPRKDAVWRYSREEHERHVEENLVWWGATGNYRFPKMKRFRANAPGALVPRTLWTGDEVDTTRRAKQHVKDLFPDQEPFTTPKPERLLDRIIHIGSQKGDIVLDCFLGSGTTAAVAHKMNRRWVGIERSGDTLSTFAIPRLQKVVAGDDPGGVTELRNWRGGGGFRVLDVAPSMFTEDGGMVYLAEWATNGRLAEACAAQLHFDAEPDPPFAGRRGRMRLAVIDGLVNPDVVQLLVTALPEDERLTVCGTAVDPEVRGLLRELRLGSTARKIPQAILEDYRLARWVPRGADGSPSRDGDHAGESDRSGDTESARTEAAAV
jgi:adenine-specific DNA-methyltransferase